MGVQVGFHHRVLWVNQCLDHVVVVFVGGWDYPEDEGEPLVVLGEIIAEDGYPGVAGDIAAD